MNNYQKSLIEEHSQLVVRFSKLESNVYGAESDKDDKIEFANKAVQLAAMRKYLECLEARMANAGVEFDGQSYFEKVATIAKVEAPVYGSDYDVDSENLAKGQNGTESK